MKGGSVICHLDIGYKSTVQKFFLDFLLGMCGWPFISITDSTNQNEPTLHRKYLGRKSYLVADVHYVFRPRMFASALNTYSLFLLLLLKQCYVTASYRVFALFKVSGKMCVSYMQILCCFYET